MGNGNHRSSPPSAIGGPASGATSLLPEAPHENATDLTHDGQTLRLLFDQSLDGMLLLENAHFIDCNQAAVDMLGYPGKEEIISLPPWELSPEFQPDGRPSLEKAAEYMQTALQRGALRFEWMHRTMDGHILPVEVMLTSISFNGRELLYTVWRDIRDRWEAHDALRRSERQFRELYQTLPDGLTGMTMNGDIIQSNPAFQTMVGYSQRELFRLTYEDITPAKWHEKELRILTEQVMVRGYSDPYEKEYTRKDGTIFPVELVAYLERQADGTHTGMWAVVRNITERKLAETRLRESEEKFRMLVEDAPFGLSIMRRDKTFEYFNKPFTRMLGYTLEDLPNKETWFALAYPDPEYRAQVASTWTRDLGENTLSKKFRSRVFKVRCKSGEEKHIHFRAVKLKDGKQLLSYEDNTVQRAMEERLRRSEEKYRSILESIEEGYYETDLQSRITFFNDAMCDILGYTPEEMQGAEFKRYFDKKTRKRAMRVSYDCYRNALPSGSFDWAFVKRDGSKRVVEVSISLMRDKDGAPSGFRGIARDITGRKLAEETLKIQKAYMEELIECAPEAIILTEKSGTILRINEEFTRLFGYRSGEALGRHVDDLIVPDHLRNEGSGLANEAAHGKRVEVETVRRAKDGSLIDVSVLGAPIRIEGEQIGVYGIYRDITARKKAEETIRESEERHRIVLEAAPDPVVVYDMENAVTYLNPAFSSRFGWTLEETKGRKIDFVPKESLPETLTMINKVKRGEAFSGVETRRRTKDGEIVDVSVSGAVFVNSQGGPKGSVITLRDITERKQTEEEIRFLAYHDALTGLPNRKSFYENMEEELERSRRRKGQQQFAILFLDLDKFKYVNDNLGHDVGDELLNVTAHRLRDCLRKSDHLFRLGGDEFTVILTDISRDLDMAKVAEKIREEVAKPCVVKGHSLKVTVSIGISVFPDDGGTVEDLVKNADMAMYAAKDEGAGYRFFTEEMNRNALERIQLETSLHHALESNQFHLHYQPLVDAEQEKLAGFEALLRWRHPKLGSVSPVTFIPLAEETGIIVPLGRQVLREACQQIRRLRDMGRLDLHIAVNVSPLQFREQDFVESVEQAMKEAGIPPTSLALELTESGVMEKPEEAIAKMRVLRIMGIRFSIDDFGTGYSSLSYLKRFPINALKIDRSFVADALSDRDDREIVKTIVAMAGNLGIETVAEGIETREQLNLLLSLGCNRMQGFYFGRPMPAEAMEEMLRKGEFPAG